MSTWVTQGNIRFISKTQTSKVLLIVLAKVLANVFGGIRGVSAPQAMVVLFPFIADEAAGQ
jgi:hypothetical protein